MNEYTTIPAPKDTCDVTFPEMSCTRSVKPTSKLSYNNLSIENLKYLAKIYNISGYTKMTKITITNKIKEKELNQK